MTSRRRQLGFLLNPARFAAAGGGALQPPLLDAGGVLYAPTIQPGAVSVLPGLLDASAVLYAPEVGLVQTVAPGLLDASAVMYGPSVATGAVTLQPVLITEVSTLYAATVTGGAEVTYLGRTVGGANAGTLTHTFGSLVGGTGGTIQTGDLLIAFHARASAGIATAHSFTTSGYTNLAGFIQASDTRRMALAAAWKIAGGSVDTDISGEFTGGTGNRSLIGVLAFRAANATTPIDVTTTSAAGANSALAVPAAITPVTAGALVVMLAGCTQDATPTVDMTGPANMGEFFQDVETGTSTSVRALGALEPSTSGAFTPGAITGGESTTSDSWCAFTVAIRPA